MGRYLSLLIMDCPEGYVTRITKLRKPLPYPTFAEHLPKQLLPILHVIWHARGVMTATLETLKSDTSYENPSFDDEDDGRDDISQNERPVLPPPCFTPRSAVKTTRKRKLLDLPEPEEE
ncbi:hypothetical protein EC973_001643 [Apophysomyces ossiformis]|uniref:Uncharacterized protein n=1 Tax=Apophysomyces ossiformis TaxID=679940 RepID=A0A8H7BRK0_9FUNG|nr:hypothetical protein EC973_001643 [Apophysomyces ossiformis]